MFTVVTVCTLQACALLLLYFSDFVVVIGQEMPKRWTVSPSLYLAELEITTHNSNM